MDRYPRKRFFRYFEKDMSLIQISCFIQIRAREYIWKGKTTPYGNSGSVDLFYGCCFTLVHLRILDVTLGWLVIPSENRSLQHLWLYDLFWKSPPKHRHLQLKTLCNLSALLLVTLDMCLYASIDIDTLIHCYSKKSIPKWSPPTRKVL